MKEEYHDYVRVNQEILNKWRAKYPLKEQALFAEDGIMNKGEFDRNNDDGDVWRNSGNENEMWATAPLRVLFLTKDENISRTGKVWDVRRETFHQKGTNEKQNIISDSTFYRNEQEIFLSGSCLLRGWLLLHNNKYEANAYDGRNFIKRTGETWKRLLYSTRRS